MKIEDFERLIDLSNELTRGLENIEDHLSYMRQRETFHTDTITDTNRSIIVWTVIEALTLIGLAYWQFKYIQKFFEVKRVM